MLTAVLTAVLAACGGDSEPETVTGIRDSVRHVTPQTVRDTRPRMVRNCVSDSREVKHSKRSNGKTKTWYTTEKYQNCTKVRRGTESYTRVVRRERWCVELDDVGGRSDRDDVWYRVRPSVYDEVRAADERTKVTFAYDARGC